MKDSDCSESTVSDYNILYEYKRRMTKISKVPLNRFNIDNIGRFLVYNYSLTDHISATQFHPQQFMSTRDHGHEQNFFNFHGILAGYYSFVSFPTFLA